MTRTSGEAITYRCALAATEAGLVDDARIDVDPDGRIACVGTAEALRERPEAQIVRDLGPVLLTPGLVNAHSHAFQRSIRGATQARRPGDPSSFWSWRDAMYRVANALDPDALLRITELAYREMMTSGITCVGEFHYLHHQPDGTPYDDPNEMSWRVVEAARRTGIRLVLLEVYYARAAAEREPLPEQRRFCDGSVDAYLRRVETLSSRGIRVGITPHSVRAVGRRDLERLAEYARTHDLPFHIHVSEQPRENEECRAEHGCSPMQLLAACGATDRPGGLTAVHAIHLDEIDRGHLAGQTVCACPTTEADLADGIVEGSVLARGGTTLALGTDSNGVIDLVQEARLLEMHERLATGSRHRLSGLGEAAGRLGPALLRAATVGGATALGWPELGVLRPGGAMDATAFDLHHPFFAEVAPEHALDALFAAGTSAPVRHVIIDGVEVDPA
jgi:formimidoylglutamate deiminase